VRRNGVDKLWKEEVYNAGFRPENFRCGPGPYDAASILVPQSPLGFNFKDAGCYQHDVCYGTCGKTQEQCDNEFLTDLQKECNAKGSWLGRPLCYLMAQSYYGAVSSWGKNAFQESQKYNNCCEEK
jgi:hypothetical protein